MLYLAPWLLRELFEKAIKHDAVCNFLKDPQKTTITLIKRAGGVIFCFKKQQARTSSTCPRYMESYNVMRRVALFWKSSLGVRGCRATKKQHMAIGALCVCNNNRRGADWGPSACESRIVSKWTASFQLESLLFCDNGRANELQKEQRPLRKITGPRRCTLVFC